MKLIPYILVFIVFLAEASSAIVGLPGFTTAQKLHPTLEFQSLSYQSTVNNNNRGTLQTLPITFSTVHSLNLSKFPPSISLVRLVT